MIWNHRYFSFSARKGPCILGQEANLVLTCKKNSEEFLMKIFVPLECQVKFIKKV